MTARTTDHEPTAGNAGAEGRTPPQQERPSRADAPELASLRSLELDRVIALVSLDARTSLGREALSRRSPAFTLEECEARQSTLFEATRWIATEGPLPFAGLADVRFLLSLEDVLELSDSWSVLRSMRATQLLREMIGRGHEAFPHLGVIASTIDDLDDTINTIGRFFTRDGKLREEASAELRSLRTRIHSKRTAIQRALSDLMNRHAEAIQEPLVTIRNERYCIPVRTDHRNAVPGILHERSGSGQSLFIEPMSVVEMNNDLAELLLQEREEIARITRFVSERIVTDAERIVRSALVAAEIDAIHACAVFAGTVRATRPAFTSERRLKLCDARHPLLDERLARHRAEAFGETPDEQRRAVPVSIDIGGDQPALLVSGPNAGGKTVALKTAGLLVAMAVSGLPVPASEGTVLPVVDSIHALIGDDQDVLEHLSTFSAYLMRLKGILARVTPRSLVLVDELGSGTDPEEGSAIAAAVIEHLLDLGCLLIATTHLGALKTSALSEPRIISAGMEFDTATGRPTYHMIIGVPGRSRAIEIAEMLGFPPAIVRAAREKVGERFGAVDDLLARLRTELATAEEHRQELAKRLDEARDEARRARDEATRLATERTEFERKARKTLDQVRREVDDRLRAEIRALRQADRTERTKADPERIAAAVIEPLDRVIQPVAPSRAIAAGDRVEHRRFGLTGRVLTIEGDKVRLEAGGKKMQASLGDLVLLEETTKAGKGSRPAAVTSTGGDDRAPEPSAELNLIGMHVEEALEESDKFIDRCLLEGRKAVRIIHGFGSGTLRRAIREYLRKHPGVSSAGPAGDGAGGDGATVAILDV